ncbi:MAG: hypothetical protein ACE5F1_22050 [Planctomycetota bacterium]
MNGSRRLLGQVLMISGLAVPLLGLAFALTASSEDSDMQVIGIEVLALTLGFFLFSLGRKCSADR